MRDLWGPGPAGRRLPDEGARKSGQQGWWNAYGDIPYSVCIGLKAEAAAIRSCEPQVISGLLQTSVYARAVITGTIPHAPAEQAATRLEVRLRRQERISDPGCPLRLWVVLDESALRRVGSQEIMREQLERLVHISTRPHITVQVLPHDAGAHPGVSGQFSILQFAGETFRPATGSTPGPRERPCYSSKASAVLNGTRLGDRAA